MKKTIVGVVLVAALAVAVAAFADKGQLMQILQEHGIMGTRALGILPASGPAPLTTTFTVNNPTGTEAIDFGDGHSTGSNGCVKNAQGFCDLSKPVLHTYQLPGSYKVTLYRGANAAAVVVTTQTVTVTIK